MSQPQYYITRPNGDRVALIAVDELPESIILEGVPKILPLMSTIGMHHVGDLQLRQEAYAVKFSDSSSSNEKSSGQSSEQAHQNISDMLSNMSASQQIAAPDKTHVPAMPTSVIASKPAMMPGQKKYCTYWLRKGECDYAQQGCMYRHDMPQDIETLNQLGFRDIPQWYRNQYGVGSFLASKGAGAAFRKSDTGSKNMVSDPSSSRFRGPSRYQRGGGRRRVTGIGRAEQTTAPLINLLDDDISSSHYEADSSATSTSGRCASASESEVPATILPAIPANRAFNTGGHFDIEIELVKRDEERGAGDDARCVVVSAANGNAGTGEAGGRDTSKPMWQRTPRHHPRQRNR